MGKPTLNLRIDAEVKEALAKLAKRERRSVTQYLEVLIIREAIQAGFMPPEADADAKAWLDAARSE